MLGTSQKNLGYFMVSASVFLILIFLFLPPSRFPVGADIEIREGAGLQVISYQLKEEGLLRSPFWFRTFAILLGGEREMKAGIYHFDRPHSSFALAWRISRGDYGVEMVRMTIPEGFDVKKISALFDERFEDFDHNLFEREAPQGFLFPDTYFFPVTATASSTIKTMRDNFDREIASLGLEIRHSGRTLEEIVTMASILEGEVRGRADREIVSGILWKRLKIGMPLQVDVERWTYDNRGLPPQPVNNPGLVSIESALRPKESPYLYFITDSAGVAHYSKDFDEHRQKIQKYLK